MDGFPRMNWKPRGRATHALELLTAVPLLGFSLDRCKRDCVTTRAVQFVGSATPVFSPILDHALSLPRS